jgi:RNA polymerase sigma-70 factor (ECF subfamily)
MDEHQLLAEQFEANRDHLQAVAYRMLGSLAEADDAVQAAWLRLSRADANDIDNLGGWLTTVVARVSLDMLRSRKSRREDPLEDDGPEPFQSQESGGDPERETQLADSVGLALLVVLDTLAPDERLAFVLHDVFAVPFEEIAPIVDRSPDAARQLASRARRRVRGASAAPSPELTRQREVVEAFLAASRSGDFNALLALLDPGVVFRVDARFFGGGNQRQFRGAENVAKQFSGRALGARPVLVNGTVGAVVAPLGKLAIVLSVTVTDGKIVVIDAIGEPDRLAQIELSVLDG